MLTSQLAAVVCTTVALALVIHFPIVVSRPTPAPTKLYFVLIVVVSLASLLTGWAAVRRHSTSSVIVVLCSLILWFVGCYALTFVWINTYGT